MDVASKRPTRGRSGIREVAELAGVGIASVSRVLSGQPGASARMTARVLEAARRLGYTPNLLAQSFRRRVSRSIGFVGSNITNLLLASIVSGAESILSAAGFSVLLTHSGGAPDVEAQRIEVLLQRQVDGLILLPATEAHAATVTALLSTPTPTVVIDRAMPAELKVGYVLSDHYQGVSAASRHLLEAGHRRLGLIVGRDLRPSRERIRAVQDSYRALRLRAHLTIDSGELSAEHGERAIDTLLAGKQPPTAVILGGNQLLEGALRALRRRGVTWR